MYANSVNDLKTTTYHNNQTTSNGTEVKLVDPADGVTALAPSIFAARGGETIIRELFPKDVETAGILLNRAFEDDPWLEYCLPQEKKRLRYVVKGEDYRSKCIAWFFGKMLEYGTKYGRVWGGYNKQSGLLEGVAMWQPPYEAGVSLWNMLKLGLTSLPMKFGMTGSWRLWSVIDASEKQHARCMKNREHWSLYTIGVSPELQRKGIGTSLLHPVLAMADTDQVPCYLDTDVNFNLNFFRRLGWVLVESQENEGYISVYSLVREPRKPFVDKPLPPPEKQASVSEVDSGHPEEVQPLSPRSSVDRKDPWNIAADELKFQSEIGRGAFGVVFKCLWRNTLCVAKRIQSDEETTELFLKEVYNVKNLRNHPNICTLYGICKNPVCIVMEYVSGGSLSECLVNDRITINQKTVISFAKDIASGMGHLHAENILHLDLACRNLLVAPKGKEEYTIKITDFGLSRVIDNDTYIASKGSKFPVRWTAPETLSMRYISRASDVWSYGVTIWELIEASMPYAELDNEEVRTEVKNGKRLPRPTRIAIPDSLWTLMQSCWLSSPQQRPTFDSIFAHLCAIEKELDLASSDEEDKPDDTEATPSKQEHAYYSERPVSIAETARYYDEPKVPEYAD